LKTNAGKRQLFVVESILTISWSNCGVFENPYRIFYVRGIVSECLF